VITSTYQAILIEDCIPTPPDITRLLSRGLCGHCGKQVIFIDQAYEEYRKAFPDCVLVCTQCGEANEEKALGDGQRVIVTEHTTREFERASERYETGKN